MTIRLGLALPFTTTPGIWATASAAVAPWPMYSLPVTHNPLWTQRIT